MAIIGNNLKIEEDILELRLTCLKPRLKIDKTKPQRNTIANASRLLPNF